MQKPSFLIVIVTALFFIGCQSDFDKCMETELPRAQDVMQLSEFGVELVRFTSAAKLYTDDYKVNGIIQPQILGIPEPDGEPSYPSYPPFNCKAGDSDWAVCFEAHNKASAQYDIDKAAYEQLLSEWENSPEVLAYYEAIDTLYLEGLQQLGYDLPDLGALEKFDEDSADEYDLIDSALKIRAEEYDCWGSDRCYDPIRHELESKFGEEYMNDWTAVSDFTDAIVQSILEDKKAQYGQVSGEARELSVLTCNQNGFYE